MFEFTVNLGNILTISSFIVGGTAFVFTIKNTVESITKRLASVEGEMKKVTEILILTARQDERMNFFERRLDELKAIVISRDNGA